MASSVADRQGATRLGICSMWSHGEIVQFGPVIANSLPSLKNWGWELAENDRFGRYRYGVLPKDAGDLAFVQHMILSLNQEGVMGRRPHGVLLRGGQEGDLGR